MAHPVDEDALSAEQEEKMVNDFARQMGAPPEQQKKAG